MEKEVTIDTIIVKNADTNPRKERVRMYRTKGGRHVHGKGNGVGMGINRGNGRGFGEGQGQGSGQRFNNGEDRGRGNHINNGRRDGEGPHLEQGCNTKPTRETSVNDRGHRFYNTRHENSGNRSSVETKLFTSKDELVEYVNSREQDNAEVEIYKIEEGLYKLVIRN
ncbi:MAG: hypothetical protein QM489_03460 [Candidatus Izemoplasma sp.]